MTAILIFKRCVEAIRQGSLIERVSATDKEYHFQNWFRARSAETGLTSKSAAGTATPTSVWSRPPKVTS